jgi:hypothetical protein
MASLAFSLIMYTAVSKSSLSVASVSGIRVENITRTDEFRMKLGSIIHIPLCSR